jgi:hypothetical protein
MRILMYIFREFWGLFVDDGSLALALIAWCVAASLILPRLLSEEWSGPVFFIGCVVVLLGNVLRSAGRCEVR